MSLNSDETATGIIIVMIIILFLGGLFGGGCNIGYKFGTENGYDTGYKNGQIDALNGKWKYHLVDRKIGEPLVGSEEESKSCRK